MKNILEKINSKWFLLFLFTFLSLGMQAQWSEDAEVNAMIQEAWDNTDEGTNSTWGFDDDGNWEESESWSGNTGMSSDQSSGDGSTASQIGTITNANGAYVGPYGFGTAALIGGPYIGGVNANGVIRVYVGNAVLPIGSSPAPGWLGTVTIQPIYNYIIPNGDTLSSYNPSDPNGGGTGVTVVVAGTQTPASTLPIITPEKPCKGDPIKNPQIAPQRNSGMNGGRFGDTRSGGTQYHNGLDIKNPYGAPVYAMFDGNVSLAGNAKDKAGFIGYQTATVNGSVISVQYFHMQDAGRVTGFVHAGDIIGYQGDSGNLARAISSGASESHVHIKIKDSNGKTLNPENYLTTKFDINGQPINNCN